MEKHTIPEELVNMILLRFPVKSLVRFKCVSKPWLSLISDPQFGKSHFDLAHASTQKLFLFLELDQEMLSIDFNAPSLHDDSTLSTVNLNFPLIDPENSFDSVTILGSCRGFLLIECDQNLLIWNPCTGIHKKLSSSPLNSFQYSFLFGFGYDPSKDDYLVIIATWEFDDDHNDVTRVGIFSSRANMWQEFEGSHLCNNISVSYNNDLGLHFSQAIHWLAHHDDLSVDFIMVFDLVEREFTEIHLPNDFDCDTDYCKLRVLGGCLSICVACRNNIAGGIWVMEEYKKQPSWTKSHIIMPPCNMPSRNLSPICLTRNGDIVLGSDTLTELVKISDRGDVLEHRRYCDCDDEVDCDCDMFAFMLTESLLSLPCDNCA